MNFTYNYPTKGLPTFKIFNSKNHARELPDIFLLLPNKSYDEPPDHKPPKLLFMPISAHQQPLN
jgi:hypothetical protein